MPPAKRATADAMLMFPEIFSGARTSVRRNLHPESGKQNRSERQQVQEVCTLKRQIHSGRASSFASAEEQIGRMVA